MSRIALHHILVKSELLAQDLMNELKLGASFVDLASEYSVCPSAKNQGFAGHHAVDDLPSALVQAIYSEEAQSAYLGPVKTLHGFHILSLVERPARSMLLDDLSLHSAD